MPFRALHERDFLGRQEELAILSKKALRADTGTAQSAVLVGARGLGKTELFKQLFGFLFWKQDRVAPFYYFVNSALLSASTFSKTYLIQFLCQRLAFEKKEQSLFSCEGMSLAALSMLVEDRNAGWAKEIIDQYEQNSVDPINALRIALAAPHRSALSSGTPVAVLIDEFHRLQNLSVQGTPDPQLVSLFEEPLSFTKAPHIITGNAVEILEMPVASILERIPISPLEFKDAASKILAPLRVNDFRGNAPPLLLRHLGGNPFYLGCIGKTVATKINPEDKDFWNAYLMEILGGGLALLWSSTLKGFFPELGTRKTALAISHKIYHSSEPLSCNRIAASFTLSDDQAETILHKLYLSGIIRGEFGVFRSVEDSVLRDIVDCFYMREILAKPSHDLEQETMARLLPERPGTISFDLTLPMAKEAELVAAQCLDQIGKNLHLSQDVTGQLQIAVIEACINAMEHSRGTEKKIYVSVTADEKRLEVSIESSGQEFIVQETGEPFSDREAAKSTGRGWGIKLMKRFADDLRFEKTPRGIKTVLIKQLDKVVRAKKEDTTKNA
ncbi:MAG TPA: ATP-binding protein [Nitrospirota bacterium]|nr:ATP-binding protein [Nitrospirota bacterium]